MGEVQGRVDALGLEKYRLLVLSDHGFKTFEHKVHLNHWLVQNGYMTLSDPAGADLSKVDWSKTRAYALGLNSLYLNVAGREGQGIVQAAELESLLEEIRTRLLDWKTPDGEHGDQPRACPSTRPSTGRTRAWDRTWWWDTRPATGPPRRPVWARSAQTALEDNHDHWGGDHCIDSQAVPACCSPTGTSGNMPGLSFRDIPFLALGKHLDQSYIKPPSQTGSQGQKDLEERLKGLGYL